MLGVFVSPHYATDHSVYLTYSEPGDERDVEPGARARAAGHRRGHGEPGGTAGAVARHAEGPRRTVRRPDRVLARRPVPVPDGRRSPAHDARAGSEHGGRQDPAPDARRQAGAGQSDGRKDGRGERSADQSAARHRSGQDRARDQHLHVPRGRTWRRRRPGPPVIGRRTVWRSRPTAGCGKSSTAREAATS